MYYFFSCSTCPSLGTGCSFSWLLCLFDILHQCELCISILTSSLSNSKDHTVKNVTWGVLWALLTTDSLLTHWFLQQAGKEWLLSILSIQQILTEWHFLPGTELEAGNTELVRKVRLGDGYTMGEIWMWLTRRRKRCPYQSINLYSVSSPETMEKSMWNIGRGYV